MINEKIICIITNRLFLMLPNAHFFPIQLTYGWWLQSQFNNTDFHSLCADAKVFVQNKLKSMKYKLSLN